MTRKIPKKISKNYLQNAALHYLQRYATSEANLKRVLKRKIDRSCRHHGDDAAQFLPLVDDLVARYAATGLLDDTVYARARVASLRRAGKSRAAITAALRGKGLNPAVIAAALEDGGEDSADAEYAAALALAKKKRLGPFRTVPATDIKDRQKDMSAMARAGFSYDVARRVLQDDGEE